MRVMISQTMNTKGQVKKWLKSFSDMNIKEGWVLIVRNLLTDRLDPVLIKPEEDIREKVREYQRVGAEEVMEVYSLDFDIDTQLKEQRAWNF